jgi:PAS domain S-box-containing protein
MSRPGTPETDRLHRSLEDRDRLLVIAGRVAGIGGWTVDLRDRIVHLSDEACAIHDLPPGSTYSLEAGIDYYVPESRPLITAAFAACATDGIPYDLELGIVTRTGRRVTIRTIGEAVRGADGSVERVQGAYQDITISRALARALDSISDAFYTLDRDWRFTFLNREAERIQQVIRADALGRIIWDVFPESVGTVFDIEFHRAMATGTPVEFDAFYRPLDLWVSVRALPSDEGLAVYFRDLESDRAAAQALSDSDLRYRQLFERAGDAIVIADDTGHYVDANAAASALLGLSRDAIIGRTLNDFVVDVLDGVESVDVWAAVRAAGAMRGEVQLRRSDGDIRDVEFSAVADISPGLNLGILRDVSERRRHERSAAQRDQIIRALRHLSPGEDPEATAQAICAEIVANGDFPSAAIYAFQMEDGASAIGASFRDGRDPDSLPRLSTRRQENLRTKAADGPWVETWTGPHDGPARTAMALVGVTAAILAPIESDGDLVGVLAAGSEESPVRLQERVPALMEFAALAGSTLGPGLRRRATRATERRRIRRIISSGAFHPVFQPIVQMSTGEAIGFEALTRFRDGTPPDQVFAAAVEVGLGIELEVATIEAALEASSPLPTDKFLDLNVSPELVLARDPLATLVQGSVFPIVVEITEHVGIHDYGALGRAIGALGDDVQLAVDDAGAGFASLRHILELAPSHVKLDRTLIARIDTDPARQALVSGLVHFAAKIDALLIAEGVETALERDILLELGVTVGQGYLFGRPAAAGELEATRRPRKPTVKAASAARRAPKVT